jgi:hypothetical protein
MVFLSTSTVWLYGKDIYLSNNLVCTSIKRVFAIESWLVFVDTHDASDYWVSQPNALAKSDDQE